MNESIYAVRIEADRSISFLVRCPACKYTVALDFSEDGVLTTIDRKFRYVNGELCHLPCNVPVRVLKFEKGERVYG